MDNKRYFFIFQRLCENIGQFKVHAGKFGNQPQTFDCPAADQCPTVTLFFFSALKGTSSQWPAGQGDGVEEGIQTVFYGG